MVPLRKKTCEPIGRNEDDMSMRKALCEDPVRRPSSRIQEEASRANKCVASDVRLLKTVT